MGATRTEAHWGLSGGASGPLELQADLRTIGATDRIVYPQVLPAGEADHELVERVLPYFEPGAWCSWEPVEDPDSPSDHRRFMVVHTRLGSREALAALDRFDQEWWLDQPSSFQSGVEVTVRLEE